MDDSNTTAPVPKKRGRKPKNVSSNQDIASLLTQNVVIENTQESNEQNTEKAQPKKRGRKPKGGKIVVPIPPPTQVENTKVNVIMHLKCSLKDLQTSFTSEMEPYNSQMGSAFGSVGQDMDMGSNITSNLNSNTTPLNNLFVPTQDIANSTTAIEPIEEITTEESSKKEIWKKVKQLEQQLHNNYTNETSSACFWCTCPFDNPPIYIPKFYLKETYHVYGCFCSPECATAHLMQENIDSSIKFERYYLLNNIYGGIYNYTKNIKPAPSPHYMLEKFYGNLSIQEYRALLSNERLFLIVDKPLTRVMPELHRANEDHIINNKMIPSHQSMKRNLANKKATTKNDILAENFGLNTQNATINTQD